MCVIMVANKGKRIPEDMIQKAWDHNHDGGGAAWREGDEVVWKKGMRTVDEMLALLNEIPDPYVAHFRIGTVGGAKPTLTHPFLIAPDASTELEGRTKDAVLFHNGHWTEWNDKVLDSAIAKGTNVPTGDWSDTRGMAWMCAQHGYGFMELMTSQKGVIWTPKDYRVFTGRDGWTEINGIWCSNDNFWSKTRVTHYSYTRKICKSENCANEVYGDFDRCYTCRVKISTSADGNKSDKEEHPRTTSDVQGPPSSVVALTGRTDPLVRFMSLEDAKRLRERGGMSKNKWKDYEKAFKKLAQESGNQRERAIKRLIYITNEVSKELLRGTVH